MFNFQIVIPDVNQAWNNLCSNICRLEWFKKNNRLYMERFLRSKNNLLINEMIDDICLAKIDNDKQFCDKYFERFKIELFDIGEHKKMVEVIESAIPIVQKCYLRFEALNKSWDFKIWREYRIDINCYRAGAGYHAKFGVVDFGYCGDNFWKVSVTLVHEMLHLGIEEIIVQRFKLQQEEKERIVDNLCIYAFNEINEIDNFYKWSDGTISQYQEIAKVCSYMDECIGKQPETNLVQSIDEFLRKFPEEKRYRVV
ncbi:MAG: hypothetical protein LBE20_00690 [Deltaproteobacteria bacterium]|jgi:hypothetical protein|nr:hypothetical protein [Deltaproteobacteria bacterium]